MDIDSIVLDFDQKSVFIINIALGLVIYGVSLDLTPSDFKRIFIAEGGKGRAISRAPLIGLVGQFLVLPAVTFLLTMIIPLYPSIALGMIMVAACPGGNVSNFVTHMAKGNTALSICMTAFSTAAAVILTPFNIKFWAEMNPVTKQRLVDSDFVLDPIDVGIQIFLLLLVPLMLGMTTNMKLRWLADHLRKFFKVFSMLVFAIIVFGALAKNWTPFKAHAGQVIGIVVFHNALGYALGYVGAWLHGLAESDRRAVTIEVGMQNSALALLLIVNNFPADVRGGMMMVAAMWGIWHNISGLSLAWFWARKGLPEGEPLLQEA